jgi:hypothetical protein
MAELEDGSSDTIIERKREKLPRDDMEIVDYRG